MFKCVLKFFSQQTPPSLMDITRVVELVLRGLTILPLAVFNMLYSSIMDFFVLLVSIFNINLCSKLLNEISTMSTANSWGNGNPSHSIMSKYPFIFNIWVLREPSSWSLNQQEISKLWIARFELGLGIFPWATRSFHTPQVY